MNENFTPTEEQIDDVVGKFTPRQIAIAYLRANRRAKDAEARIKILSALTEISNIVTDAALEARNG